MDPQHQLVERLRAAALTASGPAERVRVRTVLFSVLGGSAVATLVAE
ncbi:hypothetical protein [Streptomyces sp. NPDC002054]